jgi:hypothetical protein
METKPLQHDFKELFGTIDVMGVRGYQQCLLALYKYLEAKTNYDPAKRMIDAVELLEVITLTNDKIGKLLKEAETELSEILKM